MLSLSERLFCPRVRRQMQDKLSKFLGEWNDSLFVFGGPLPSTSWEVYADQYVRAHCGFIS